jgi:hypothetical protein
MYQRLILAILSVTLEFTASPPDEGTAVASRPGRDETAFISEVAPLVKKFCGDCHGPEKHKGDLDLLAFANAASLAKARKTWESVVERLEVGDMPPEDRARPSSDQVARLSAAIHSILSTANCDLPPDPGRVTLRRLNRNEYNNTIRDLVGVPFRPADDFPSDDVGYGFDNIGDVLTTSPLLLEKYLAAAEQVAERAIVADRTDWGPVKTWQVEELGHDAGGSRYGKIGRILSSTGEIGVSHEVPREGEYILRARAFGQQAGPEPVKMEFRIEGKAEKVFDVEAVEEAPELYEVRVKLEPGKKRVAVAFLNDYYQPEDPDPHRRDRNLVVDSLEVQGPIASAPLPVPESHARIIYREPKNGETQKCAREILERFAGRAFRRPATHAELDRLVELVEQSVRDGDTFERGIQLAVAAILVSPHFLFRVELAKDTKAVGEYQVLTDFEVATRLSYFLWSSLPDDALMALAREGKLQDEATLEAQALRMLHDTKAQALVENFASQWLHLRNLKNVTPAKELFPHFDDALRQAMQRETELFFESIVREDRSILECLDADYTFLNERLAKHYEIDGVTGPEFRRVTLSGDRRAGLLGQASVLTVTSNPTRTSPVKRGKWILEQLLGTPPPPPPPDVPELKEGKDAVLKGSLRERMEQHRANPSCAACHTRMDPLGFGLEYYDAIGAWRESDGAFPIDASGTLPSGQAFRGPKELRAILKGKQKEFTRCLSEKLLTYALGRGLQSSDDCTVDRIARAVAEDSHRFSRLVIEIVKSAPFRQRRGQGVGP